LLGGTALGGATALVAAVWGHTKGIWLWVSRVILSRLVFDIGINAPGLYNFIWTKTTPAPSAIHHITFFCTYSYRRKGIRTFGAETLGALRLHWIGWRPLWITKGEQESGRQGNGVAASNDAVTFIFLRNKWFGFKPDDLIKMVADSATHRNDREDGKTHFSVMTFTGAGGSRLQAGSQQPQRGSQPRAVTIRCAYDSYRLIDADPAEFEDTGKDGSILNELWAPKPIQEAIEEAERWLAAKEWYAARGIPWRRGWLIHGLPGTGKTTLVLGIAQRLKLTIHRYDLGSMDNGDFAGFWRESVSNAPVIVLFEDFDGVFEGRKNVLTSTGGFAPNLTFDTIINAIAGVEKAYGIFLIITTNRLEMIDDALKRAGRTDRILEMTLPNDDGRRMIARRILKGFPDGDIEAMVIMGRKDSGAAFQERCTSLALEHWNQGKIS